MSSRLGFAGCGLNFGYCPHTVTVYNRATIKVLIMHLYYEYVSTVTGWGQFPTQSLIPLLRDQITRSPERTDRRRAVRSASITSYILPVALFLRLKKFIWVHVSRLPSILCLTRLTKVHTSRLLDHGVKCIAIKTRLRYSGVEVLRVWKRYDYHYLWPPSKRKRVRVSRHLSGSQGLALPGI